MRVIKAEHRPTGYEAYIPVDKIQYINQPGGGVRHRLIIADDGTEFYCRRIATTILYELEAQVTQ